MRGVSIRVPPRKKAFGDGKFFGGFAAGQFAG
jgi:hypothetical protein